LTDELFRLGQRIAHISAEIYESSSPETAEQTISSIREAARQAVIVERTVEATLKQKQSAPPKLDTAERYTTITVDWKDLNRLYVQNDCLEFCIKTAKKDGNVIGVLFSNSKGKCLEFENGGSE
jgi:hypothetical protein